jgi:hypothetical protein
MLPRPGAKFQSTTAPCPGSRAATVGPVFVFGHLGIGTRLGARIPLASCAPRWLVLGTLLPDLLDKPLYYGLSFATGKRAAELGLICGTRTLGHTALFGLLLFALLTCSGRRLQARALLAGLATHWLLDLGGEPAGALLLRLGLPMPIPKTGGPGTLAAVLFPALGLQFPIMPFHDASEHLAAMRNLYTVTGELLGFALLWRALRPGQAGWQQRAAALIARTSPPASPAAQER